MSSAPIRPRRAAFALAVASALVTTGCGAGFNAGTQLVRHPAEGAYATAGPIQVINAMIVVPPGGGTGVLSLALSVGPGTPPQRVTGIQVAQAASVDGADGLEAPSGGVLSIGTGADSRQVTVTGFQGQPGTVARVTIQLDPAGPVSLDVPVFSTDAAPEYASLTPTAGAATASPSATTTP